MALSRNRQRSHRNGWCCYSASDEREMKVNGDMLTLAREFRGLTQASLAQRVSLAQSTIAKIAGRLDTEFPDEYPILVLIAYGTGGTYTLGIRITSGSRSIAPREEMS